MYPSWKLVNMLDINTLLLTGALLSCALAVALAYAFGAPEGRAGATRLSLVAWTRAIAIQAAFWLLFSLGSSQPAWLSVVVVNTLSIWAIAEYVRAVRLFLGVPPRATILLVVVALAIVGNFWFAYVQPSYDARVILVSLCGASLMLWLCWQLFGVADATIMRAARLTAVAFLAGAGSLLLRLADTLAQPGLTASESSPQQWALLLFVVLPVFSSLGFLLMHASRANARLSTLASTDPLTGALNRRALEASAASVLAGCRRQGRPASALLLDIDRFKRINDSHGHEAGDQCLVAVQKHLLECLRQEDVVARVGGEEFVILLPGADRAAALIVSERIRARVQARAIAACSGEINMTVSIGVSQWQSGEDSLDDLLRRADVALYAAKHAGRNRVVAADSQDEAGAA